MLITHNMKNKKLLLGIAWAWLTCLSANAEVKLPDAKGAWKLALSTPSAGGPYTITFDDGKLTEIRDILMGELWLCSGQSNMEMPMKGFKNQPVENSNTDVMNSRNPQLRLFTVKRSSSFTPKTDVVGTWQEAVPATVREFSATAYYFG